MPEFGARFRQFVLQHHVESRPDKRPVQPAGAAEDQHYQHRGGLIEVEDAERHQRVGLREQCAGDAGEPGRDRVSGHQPSMNRRTDRVHASDVFADADQRSPERRIDDAADRVKADQQHDEAIKIIGVAVKIVIEPPEQRRDCDARNAVITAGEITEQVAELLQHDRRGEGQHQQRQAAVTQQ